MTPPKPYQITVGCIAIDNSLSSRDFRMPEGVDSLDAALEALSEAERTFAGRGYKLYCPSIKRWNGQNYETIGRWTGSEYRFD